MKRFLPFVLLFLSSVSCLSFWLYVIVSLSDDEKDRGPLIEIRKEEAGWLVKFTPTLCLLSVSVSDILREKITAQAIENFGEGAEEKEASAVDAGHRTCHTVEWNNDEVRKRKGGTQMEQKRCVGHPRDGLLLRRRTTNSGFLKRTRKRRTRLQKVKEGSEKKGRKWRQPT
mmetsp:Transcript_15609/g.31655  ORF Transcript_15609/g.31655 Transcript_15609/m.31655 type:complete len:171 (+) Transcript_15609:3106-3618(+)